MVSSEATVIQSVPQRPVVSYWRCGDIDLNYSNISNKMTEINVLTTRVVSDKLIEFCANNQKSIYLHIVVNGMAGTAFEPNIPPVAVMFGQIQKLLKVFPKRQILVICDPVIPNPNGLKAIELLLRLFSEYKLKLTYMRFTLLSYANIERAGKAVDVIANRNISKRITPALAQYVEKDPGFFRDYYLLVAKYKSIIHVDNGMESLIGVRELLPFGYRNEWIDGNGQRSKLVEYENNNRNKPITNVISENKRCHFGCVLCPFKD